MGRQEWCQLRLQERCRPSGSKYQKGKHHRVDVMAETGLYEDGARDIRRISDPHLRIKDLDRDGVDAEVIYGILGAASRLNDREAGNEMLRIYNDWLKDFCSHYPDRHIGLACLPYGDIDAAVKEVYRVAKMGIKGLELSCSWDMEPMWHPMWDPLWKAVNDVQLPLHFHTFPNVPPGTIEKHGGRVGRSVFFTVVSGFQMNLVTSWPRSWAPTCWSASLTSASPSARAAAAGSPTRSTAWTSSGRTASSISASR